MKNREKFNIYVFLSTFARNLIEVFIPIILYKFGYSLQEIIYYFLLTNIFSLMISIFCFKIFKKINYKIFSFIGIVSFAVMQLLLNNMVYSSIYIILIAFLYALYRRGYWISRRFYNLNIISKKNISISYSIIVILNQLGLILSSYVGAVLLDFVDIKILITISIILFIVSIIPLYFIDIKYEHKGNSVKFRKTIKKIGIKRLYLFGSYELLNVLKFLFPLYLIIYVKDNYQTVGFFDLITNLATLILVYIYGKKTNGSKNFLNESILLVVIIYILKANVISNLLIIITFLEGIFTKMYEISINKEFYSLSKQFEYENYNFAYEFTQNFSRSFVTLILLFLNNIHLMIYTILFFIIIGIFINSTLESKEKRVH